MRLILAQLSVVNKRTAICTKFQKMHSERSCMLQEINELKLATLIFVSLKVVNQCMEMSKE